MPKKIVAVRGGVGCLFDVGGGKGRVFSPEDSAGNEKPMLRPAESIASIVKWGWWEEFDHNNPEHQKAAERAYRILGDRDVKVETEAETEEKV